METTETMKTLMTTERVAEVCGVKPTTVAQWRLLSDGPKFIKLPNGAVRYEPEEIARWAASRRRISTTESEAEVA